MRLTIIRENGLVAVDGLGYQDLDLSCISANIHAVQWYGEVGEIEFIPDGNGEKPFNERFTSVEQFNCVLPLWQAAHDAATAPPKPPTDDELLADCKAVACQLLLDSDWSQLPDAQTRLQNSLEFDAYRAQLRDYAINPVTHPTWPTCPSATWA